MRRLIKQEKGWLAVVAAALVGAMILGAVRAHRLNAVVQTIERNGGRVMFTGPQWLWRITGTMAVPISGRGYVVDLSNCPRNEEGFRRLIALATTLDSLEGLLLVGAPISDDSLEPLAHLSKLRRLWLSGTSITGDGLKWIAKLESLEDLDVSRTKLNDSGLRHIAGLSELRSLNLDDTAVSDAGVGALFQLKNLEELNVSNTGVTDAGLEQLTSKLPDLYVFDD